jgi:hypothetical protein
MSGVTLDAGALIALDRDDRKVLVLLARAKELGARVTVPATALAQSIRRPAAQARLARLIRQPTTDVRSLDAVDATSVGILLAASRTRHRRRARRYLREAREAANCDERAGRPPPPGPIGEPRSNLSAREVARFLTDRRYCVPSPPPRRFRARKCRSGAVVFFRRHLPDRKVCSRLARLSDGVRRHEFVDTEACTGPARPLRRGCGCC